MRIAGVTALVAALAAAIWWFARDGDGRERSGEARPALGRTEEQPAEAAPERKDEATTARFATDPPVGGVELRVPEHGRVATGDDGTAEQALPPGAYTVVASARGYGVASVSFRVVDADVDVRIPLSKERRVKVLVRSKKKQAPVEGARLTVYTRWALYGAPEATTDKYGEAWLTRLNGNDKKLRLLARAPGAPEQERFTRNLHAIPDDADEMVVEIELPRTISWEVLDGDIPAPEDGTEIEIRTMAGSAVTPPPRGRMENGRLVVPGWAEGYAAGLAIGPQKTIARLYADRASDTGRPTKFEKAANITIRFRHADGTPAKGVKAGIYNQGNNQMAAATSDGQGTAQLKMLSGRLAEIFVLGTSKYDKRAYVGTVDLKKGDLEIEHTIKPLVDVEIKTTLDGRPVAPKGLRMRGLLLTTLKIDREQGLMTAQAQVTGKVMAFVEAEGCRNAREWLPAPEPGEPLRHTFAMEKGYVLTIRTVGKKPGKQGTHFQREGEHGWESVYAQPEYREALEVYRGLEPGRYRVYLNPSGAIWGPVTVPGATEIVVDYTRLAFVSGRVEMPEGYKLYRAAVRVVGAGRERPHWKEATFRIPVPAEVPVTLSVEHPMLVCEKPWTGTGGAEGIVLKLVEGPTLRLFARDLHARYGKTLDKLRPGTIMMGTRIEVRLYNGELDGEPAHRLWPAYRNGAWYAGGFPAGAYNVWIDIPESVPFVRRVTFKKGENDLGEFRSEPGSTVRVKIRVKEPFEVPRTAITAYRLDPPTFSRLVNAYRGVVTITGLPAGRYRILGMATMLTGGKSLVEEIELDGVSDKELTYDLR